MLATKYALIRECSNLLSEINDLVLIGHNYNLVNLL